ncbi:MAG: ubiquinol-cytochrome c reductase iron-sulfur subunit [Chloroflexi bacterium]|nr:ubiquinol-cytochrome c reductase iron-sulfur subunit [Chloroflexota bacterium]
MSAVAPQAPTTTPMTRREFLYYVWGASMALFMAESAGALIWFALPRFREGEFGGKITLDVTAIPGVDTGPKDFPEGRFWLVNLGPQSASDPRRPDVYPAQQGLMAIYKVCVHLGCLYKWVPTNNRFECPCHGSKYLADGVRVDGPARRNLDKFVLEAQDDNGNTLAKTAVGNANDDANAGAPIVLPAGTTRVVVDTGKKIVGADNTAPGGGK